MLRDEPSIDRWRYYVLAGSCLVGLVAYFVCEQTHMERSWHRSVRVSWQLAVDFLWIAPFAATLPLSVTSRSPLRSLLFAGALALLATRLLPASRPLALPAFAGLLVTATLALPVFLPESGETTPARRIGRGRVGRWTVGLCLTVGTLIAVFRSLEDSGMTAWNLVVTGYGTRLSQETFFLAWDLSDQADDGTAKLLIACVAVRIVVFALGLVAVWTVSRLQRARHAFPVLVAEWTLLYVVWLGWLFPARDGP